MSNETWEEKLARIPRFLAPAVEQYSAVFQDPIELPPERGHEHTITLKKGSNPVGTRPYRYPQI